MKRTIIAGIVLATAAGCVPALEEARPQAAPAPTAASAPVATYCYQTLGRVDCYRAPREGDRLVGVDIQPPR